MAFAHGWLFAVPAAFLAGCVYPITTDTVRVAENALNMPPAERSVMRLGKQDKGYILIEPDFAGLGWSTFSKNYSPPGAVAVAPGKYSFRGGKFWGFCEFTVAMLAGHEYRPTDFSCRYHYNSLDAVPEPARDCLAANPESKCCTVLEDVGPDGARSEIILACEEYRAWVISPD